jgi:DNA adenine methylase
MNIEPCKSPLRWVGGKHYISSWILSYLPEHKIYVEPFGGGAHVLCNKDPGISQLEVYNDTYDEVIEFFEVLQNKEEFKQLLYKLRNSPYSRKYFLNMIEFKPKNKLEKVYRWIYLTKCSFGGKIQNRTPSWTCSRRHSNDTSTSLMTFTKKIIKLRDRFRRIQIEKLDFREVIKKYDSSNTLFYCDPPYVDHEHYYQGGFGLKDHEDLAILLNNIKGKAAVSYYPCELVAKLYPGWKVEEKHMCKYSNNLAIGGERTQATEILLMNY